MAKGILESQVEMEFDALLSLLATQINLFNNFSSIITLLTVLVKSMLKYFQ